MIDLLINLGGVLFVAALIGLCVWLLGGETESS